MNSSEKNNHFK